MYLKNGHVELYCQHEDGTEDRVNLEDHDVARPLANPDPNKPECRVYSYEIPMEERQRVFLACVVTNPGVDRYNIHLAVLKMSAGSCAVISSVEVNQRLGIPTDLLGDLQFICSEGPVFKDCDKQLTNCGAVSEIFEALKQRQHEMSHIY